MPHPEKRDLALVQSQLESFLARSRPSAEGLAIADLRAPSTTGFSSETLLFEVNWRERGAPRSEKLVARIEPRGFNVFPNELENVISLCPGVVECAAIGIPDEKQGEAIKVFVVKSDPTLSEEDVGKYCRQNLTGYKVPKYIEFRDDLPKTNVGKILRRELRSAK